MKVKRIEISLTVEEDGYGIAIKRTYRRDGNVSVSTELTSWMREVALAFWEEMRRNDGK